MAEEIDEESWISEPGEVEEANLRKELKEMEELALSHKYGFKFTFEKFSKKGN